MKTNYHSHTKWCRHGSGEIEEFIVIAIQNNIKEYAVSEHIPYPGLRDMRIYSEEMDDFINEINLLQEKYKDKIKILKALECEYFPNYHDYYVDMKKKYNIDFLILGQHYEDETLQKDFFNNYSIEDIQLYEKCLLAGINSDLFAFIAHPDVYLNIYPFDDPARTVAQNIFKLCSQKNMPLEINANGLRYKRGYPSLDFWKESKKYELTYLINSDCHHPKEVMDDAITKTYNYAKDLGLHIEEYLDFTNEVVS